METVYNFRAIFTTCNGYNAVRDLIKERLIEDFSSRKVCVGLQIGKETFRMTLGKLFINLLLMRPFAEFGVIPTEDDVFLGNTVTQDVLDEYFNHIVRRFRSEEINADYDKIRNAICETMNEMCDLSGEYNVKIGNSVSFRDLIRLEVEDDEFNQLVHTDVKPGQFSDIESQFNDLGKRLIVYFKNHKDTELHPFVASETGINKKQFTQAVGFVGLKPSMTGEVIPVTIKDNFLRGLSGLESYYISACGSKKALVTNNKYTKKSGYLTRKLELSNIDHYHDNSITDCGTTHFVVFRVDSERKFRQIIGRHYYDLDAENNKVSELKTITEESKEIIGKTIGLRSPVTCCSERVCATCYGRELSAVNKDINTGLSGTLKLTEPLTQRLLSAKHLLSTKTDKVEWGDSFKEVFTVNMDAIYFAPEADCSVHFRKPTSEEFDEDEDAFYTDTLQILQTGSKKSVEYKSPVKLFINKKLLPTETMKNDDSDITINPKSLNEDEYIFKYQSKNTELTRSLQEILDLIENTDHLGITDYSEFVNKFDDLLIENDLDYINSIHIEMISAVLIRDAVTGKRLDFSKEKLDDYIIHRVSKSVMNAPLAVSLSFERINDQLIDLGTYDKDDISMMDNLFL